MTMRFLLISFFLFSFLLISCQKKQIKYVQGSLDNAFEASKKNGIGLFVIAYIEGCEVCDKFVEQFNTSNSFKSFVSNKYLFYKCELNKGENKYLAKSSYNIASPTIYIFDSKGKLKNVIRGFKDPLQIVKLINKKELIEDNYRIGLNNHDEYVKLINMNLTSYKILRSGALKKDDLKKALALVLSSLKIKPYFFNNYLASILYFKMGNKQLSKEYATNSLKYNDSFSIYLYPSERLQMKHLANENYDKSNDSYITFNTKKEDIKMVKIGSQTKVIFKFVNSGKSPLIISNILGSCDCMNFKWENRPIQPNNAGKIEITYHAKSIGLFNKMLFVTSNAVNEQELLTISGTVIK